jgi:Tfp pilus assembly pilus retraction ATPase PilT
MASRQAPRLALTDDDLVALLGVIREADSVELKLTVPETEHRPVVSTLGMDPLDAEIRQVFFFDTPELTLYEHGV